MTKKRDEKSPRIAKLMAETELEAAEEIIEQEKAELGEKDAQAVPAPIQNPLFSAKTLKILLAVFCLVMVAIHLIYAQTLFIPKESYLTLHMGFSFAIMFLLTLEKTKKRIHSVILLVCIVACIIFMLYVCINVDELRIRVWTPLTIDLVVGVTMIALAFYAAVLGYGWFIPILVAVVVIYPMFGQYLPEPFTTTAYPFRQTVANLSIGMRGGLYDSTLGISADYVFLFSVFGGLLGATGVQKFFFEFGKLVVGRFRAGAAMIAIINGGLVGSVVGSAIANVAIIGPYNIPNMKREGFADTMAGAVIASAANGGQILPPVMGIIAFAMAGYSGIPYAQICLMALIPAIIYYAMLMFACHLYVLKYPETFKKVTEKPVYDKEVILHKMPSFIIPFILIIFLFGRGYSVNTVAFWSIVIVLVLSQINTKKYRTHWKDIVSGFIDGAKSGAQMGVVCAVIGLMVSTFTSSGLGLKLTSGIEQWSGGSLLLALVILYAASILAGMVGVSVAAYFTAAAFAVPALQALGVPFAIAHFFIVYPASFATITPPVALASLVASKQAGANYFKTALETCRIAFTAFIMPFFFVYAPSVLLIGNITFLSVIDIALVAFCFVALQLGWSGHLLRPMNILERLLFIGSGVLIGAFLIARYPVLVFGGVLLFALLLVLHIVATRREKKRITAT